MALRGLSAARPAGALLYPAARGRSCSSSPMSGPLMASKSINVGRLAGAIARRVGRSDPCAVDAVGPEAHHKAVKAIIMAGRYLQEESDGKRVAFVAQKVQIEARGPQDLSGRGLLPCGAVGILRFGGPRHGTSSHTLASSCKA
mmetsp:Transcript_78029/g.241908  ORF Transcript_78029/g.241908 Transcript_78029/m.241908 type:complete len:144 (-) Transcript_78029:56-487(-)